MFISRPKRETVSLIDQREALKPHSFDTLIIGGGPGGLGASIALLDRIKTRQGTPKTIGIIEQKNLGGAFAGYNIKANSSALDMIEDLDRSAIASAATHPSSQRLAEIGITSPKNAPQLYEVGHMYQYAIPDAIRGQLPQGSEIFDGNSAQKVTRVVYANGEYTAYDGAGKRLASGKNIIFATGAHEEVLPELQNYGNRVVLSQEIFTDSRILEIKRELEMLPLNQRKITIVGNSHGGWASVDKLIKAVGNLLPNGGIEVLERHATRVFFDNEAEAKAANYKYTADDVCAKTGRVNRFGGVRHDAKAMYLKVKTGQEPRVTLVPYSSLDQETERLGKARFIVQSVGLKTNAVPIFDAQNNLIGPYSQGGLVEMTPSAQIQVVGPKGKPSVLPNAYGIGIGYNGIKPSKELGGERSYKASLHAANVYRLIIGPMIAGQIVPEEPAQPRERNILSFLPGVGRRRQAVA